MKVATAAALLAFVASGGGQPPVEARKLVCFGNEPSWSVRFDGPGQARVGLPNVPPADYLGRETRNEPLKESVWRGNAQGTSGDLVLLLRDAPCSDGMSDATHPVIARASLPDGLFLAGCCRVPGAQVEAAPLEGSWRLVSLPGQASTTLAALTRPVSLRFEAGRVTGFTGCNTVTGTYTLKGNAITFGRLASTMMACPEPASSVERTLTEALRGTLPHTVTANRLSLTAASGAVDFERAAAPRARGAELDGHRLQQRAPGGRDADRRQSTRAVVRERHDQRPGRLQHIPGDLLDSGQPHHDRRSGDDAQDVLRRSDGPGTRLPEGAGIGDAMDRRRRAAEHASR